MILVIAVVVGLAGGLIIARLKGVSYQPLDLSHLWLIFLAAIPQYLAFFLPVTRTRIPDQWIPFILISTQFILLIFVWVNRRTPFVWLFGFGLVLNFLVISLNGGWMPISPETLTALGAPESSFMIGSRHGYGKDIVLTKDNTVLWILSDMLRSPDWFPLRIAYSIGDVLIAAGVIGFLFMNKGVQQDNREVVIQEH